MNKKGFIFSAVMVLLTMGFLTGCFGQPTSTAKEPANDNTASVPERVVDLSGNSDVLALLGLNVVGTANSDAYDYTRLPAYLEETLKDAAIVGYSYQDTMDIEVIMNLNPDLIVISTIQEKMYDQLTAIAPTVMIELKALDWKEDLITIAEIFEKQEVAAEWLESYEAKGIQKGEAIKSHKGEQMTYLSFLASGGQFYVFDGAGFGKVLYDDLRLEKPVGMPEQSDVSLPVVSYEGLAAIKADHIFVMATKDDYEALNSNPIWNSLPAVMAGEVTILEASPYSTQGYSVIGRLLLLDEIEALLNAQ